MKACLKDEKLDVFSKYFIIWSQIVLTDKEPTVINNGAKLLSEHKYKCRTKLTHRDRNT